MGGRKLHYLLKDDLSKIGKIGRDKFFDILGQNDLLVRPKKSFTRTTYSFHHYYKWKNLIQDLLITRVDQVWVSDITHIRVHNGFAFLFLVTDLYSRKIIGWTLNNNLGVEGALKALKMALASRDDKSESLIHHSDRGIQYCCKEYVKTLQEAGIDISMTEENHCYENAIAERVNGILKDEFFLDQSFPSLYLAEKASHNAIRIYNTKRLHLSLGYKTPENVFKMRA